MKSKGYGRGIYGLIEEKKYFKVKVTSKQINA